MPKGDGTGRGMGRSGAGRGQGDGGRGQGGVFAAGPGGYCVCPNSGEKALHQLRSPCYNEKGPKCGTPMTLDRFE